jgi:hypothetical protein
MVEAVEQALGAREQAVEIGRGWHRPASVAAPLLHGRLPGDASRHFSCDRHGR